MMNDERVAHSFLPNSFQVPNEYIDRYFGLLTSEEKVVLIYTVRRIFGFGHRQDRISLSQYANGTRNRAGKQLDYGTGLSTSAIRPALAALIRYGLLIEVARNDPRANQGALYELQLDSARVDEAGLLERASAQKQKNRARTRRARSSQKGLPEQGSPQLSPASLEEPAVPQQGGLVVRQQGEPVVGQQGGLLSDNTDACCLTAELPAVPQQYINTGEIQKKTNQPTDSRYEVLGLVGWATQRS
jgi:hypothetical protein